MFIPRKSQAQEEEGPSLTRLPLTSRRASWSSVWRLYSHAQGCFQGRLETRSILQERGIASLEKRGRACLLPSPGEFMRICCVEIKTVRHLLLSHSPSSTTYIILQLALRIPVLFFQAQRKCPYWINEYETTGNQPLRCYWCLLIIYFLCSYLPSSLYFLPSVSHQPFFFHSKKRITFCSLIVRSVLPSSSSEVHRVYFLSMRSILCLCYGLTPKPQFLLASSLSHDNVESHIWESHMVCFLFLCVLLCAWCVTVWIGSVLQNPNL